MKKLLFGGALVAAALGIGALGVKPASAMPSVHFPDGTYDIALDGYCNIFEIVKPGSAGLPGVQGTDIGCSTAHTLLGAASTHGMGLSITDVGGEFVAIIANHAWIIYGDCGGGSECIFNSGTWSFSAPVVPMRNGLPSAIDGKSAFFGSRAGGFAPMRGLPDPNAFSTDIYFVGYCDGEHLNVPGSAGSPGLDGVQTGCASNPLFGAKDNGIAMVWDDIDANFYVLQADHTWVIYVDCGDGTECVLNSGTWGFGTIGAPQNSRTVLRSGAP